MYRASRTILISRCARMADREAAIVLSRSWRHHSSSFFCGKRSLSSSTSKAPSSSVTSQDLQALRQELRALQDMMKENQATIESIATKTSQLEKTLQDMTRHVSRIGALEKMVTGVQEFLHTNRALRGVVENVEHLVQRGTPLVRRYKYAIASIVVALGILWRYRSSLVYQRTSEEVADLARMTLEQDSLRLSIQETLQTVANNPSTLRTLNELVQKLVTNEQTQRDLVNLLVFAVNTPEVQKALLDLLQVVFLDPYLQRLTGEFLLKGLDEEHVKEMLNAQTQTLVRDTVSDDSVQQATAIGVQRSLWYAVTPSFLWRFLEQKTDRGSGTDITGEEEAPRSAISSKNEVNNKDVHNVPIDSR